MSDAVAPYAVNFLYEFTVGTLVYRYTSSAITVVAGGQTYLPLAISDSGVASSAESGKEALKITAPSDFEVADLYSYSPPSVPVLLNVKVFNANGEGFVDIIWSGRVLGPRWLDDEDTVEMDCEPVTVTVGRNGLFRRYSKQCPYALYDADTCGVDKAAYRHDTTVAASVGNSLTVAALGAHTYAGGFVEWDIGTRVERRFIESVAGLTLRLMQGFVGIPVSAPVAVYPGCARTTDACATVYNNILRYGGWPHLKQRNPFQYGLSGGNVAQGQVDPGQLIALIQAGI